MSTTLKASASIKELQAALAAKQATKAQVTAILKNRIAKNSSTGAVKRAKLALAAITKGDDMVKAAFPPAKPKPRKRTTGATSGGLTQSDLDKAVAEAEARLIASLEAKFPGLVAETPPEEEESESPEETEVADAAFVEGWWSINGVEVYFDNEHGWRTEDGEAVVIDPTDVEDHMFIGSADAVEEVEA